MIRYYSAAEVRDIWRRPVERTCDNDQDPGGRVNGPGAWPTQGVDMVNPNGRTSDRRNPYVPDLRPSHWQDEGARVVMDRLGFGHPLFAQVLHELVPLRRYGVPITPEMVDRAITTVEDRDRHWREVRAAQLAAKVLMPKIGPAGRRGRFADVDITTPVVYYMRIGDRVKIGYSSNLRDRLTVVNPEELLAIETGDMAREAERHRQFAAYRTHGEWFRYEGDLVAHVQRLRQIE